MLNLTCKKIILAIFLFGLLAGPGLLQAASYNFGDNSGLNSTASSSGFDQTKKNPENFIQPIITAILSLIGVLFLGLAIFGGIKWMTAKGNDQQLEQAKQILTNAIVGLIVVAAAYAISYFVLKSIASQSFKAI
ncbi:MAG: pilin [Candidatus Falkowbacteria bacterium]|nr:pilin [Candidatus Falkowbacteria bacterium]